MYYILRKNAIEGPFSNIEELANIQIEEGKDMIWKTEENLTFNSLEDAKNYSPIGKFDLIVIASLSLSYILLFLLYMCFGNFIFFFVSSIILGIIFSTIYYSKCFKKWNSGIRLLFALSILLPYIFIPFTYTQKDVVNRC